MRYIVFESFPLEFSAFVHDREGKTVVFDTFEAAHKEAQDRQNGVVISVDSSLSRAEPAFFIWQCVDCPANAQQEGVNYCSSCGNRLR